MNHLKTLLFLGICLMARSSFAQIDLKTYTSATDTFYWKRYIHIPKPKKMNLKKVSLSGQGKILKAFMAAKRAEYPQFTNDSIAGIAGKTWEKWLYPTDINGDGHTDIIFSGPTGGPSEVVRIYLNFQDSFELVFEDYQYITRFILEKKKLVALTTGDVGCCDEYLWFTREYRIAWDKGTPVIIKGKQMVDYMYTEEPREYYPEPVPFVSAADTMLLRASAAQLNEPFNPYLDTFGNIVAKYRAKARGNVIARKTYGKGNDWFFVEMSPEVYPAASILHNIDKLPTFIRGWVSVMAVKF